MSSCLLPESSGEDSWSLGSLLEFSSVLRCVVWMGEGEDLEEVGDILGNRLWPGENSDFSDREDGGWNADGKDFNIGVSPVIENIGLKVNVTTFQLKKFLIVNLKAPEAESDGRRDSRAG